MKISKLVKKILALSFALAGVHVFAQTVSSSTFGSISSPSMPTIDAPVIGGGYYRPGVKGGTQNQSAKKNDVAAAVATEEKKLKDDASKTIDELLPSLTANEIQVLNVNGVLESVLESQHKESSVKNDESETNELLRQVLSEMEDMKNQQSNVAVTVSNTGTSRVSSSRLLRFKVNGYDVLRTCRTLFISDVQDDGTFLITGDRRYQSDGKTRLETFHVLFKADSGANGMKSYSAATVVTQDYLNENSFLYQMSQRSDMQASRTGNLVTMRTSDPDWKLELLIDLGTSSK